MFPKYIVFFVCFGITYCDISFTIVLDTTNSMREELDVVKASLGPVLNAVSNRTSIANYIIVPFNDDVQQPFLARTPRDLLTWLNTIIVSGGQECPENSLAGIARALQISKHRSYIFVFTDAYSKDPHRLGSIQNLCKTTNSRVIIFLSGSCLSESSSMGNLNVYYDVASACSGAVLRFEPFDLRLAFTYINSVTEVEWTDIYNYGGFEDYKQFSFSVDVFTKNIMIAVSGEDINLNITKVDGHHLQTEKLMDSKYTQVLSISEKDTGDLTVSIRSNGMTSATLYVKRDLPIQYGFSTKPPRSMRETVERPMPGMTNYVLFNVTHNTLKLRAIEVQVLDEDKKITLNVEDNSNTGLYIAKIFVEPDKRFRIWIKCYDALSHSKVTGPTRYVIPQKSVADTRWVKPTSEIIDLGSIKVDYGFNRMVACKVKGYPKPNIWWQDDNNMILPSEHALLEIPSVYISYVTMVNVTENSTIYCKSLNSEGEHSQSVDVCVYRPYTFEIIQTPSDETIEYGRAGSLNCKVTSYPEAQIIWYYNEDLLTQANDLQIQIEDGTLRITNMSLDNVGDYKCHIINEVNDVTYKAHVNISGIEKPEIETDTSEIVLKFGDYSYLECRVTKGKPFPTITWHYKAENDFDFRDTPEGVLTNEGKLEIASVETNHRGVYKCEATNVEGTDSAEITVKLRYPPIITNSTARSVEVREGADVSLVCDVHGSPAPRVRWELRRSGVRLPLNALTADTRHTHRFNALWNNSGDYNCIAENELGKAEIAVTVNVLVPVYIEPPKTTTMVLRNGASGILNCNILYGNPVPSTKWKFIALDSSTTVLSRGNLTSTLHLINVTRANEGSYLCIAENDVSSDSIKIDVKVQ